jgi:anaerobic C4-dicarboxylate transporter
LRWRSCLVISPRRPSSSARGIESLGVRTGGIGLGLWGVVGTAVLVFGFRLPPGSPPIDAFFIIIAVITASSAMQAAGGIDYLVSIASKIIQRNPKRLTYVAPLVAFVFTVLSGPRTSSSPSSR